MSQVKKIDSVQLDEIGRQSIRNDLNKNLFVIAGAGSGKTSMLVERMVAMVESGIDISKICAITFTKKAAAEFLSRFHSELKKKSIIEIDSTPEQIDKANKCRIALEKIDLCFTGTIDSFCNLVLSEYPTNANIPSSSAVVDEDEFIELCKKEYEKIANDVNSPIREQFINFNRLVPNGADTFARSIQDVIDVSHLDIKYPVPTVSLETAVKELAVAYESRIQQDVQTLLRMKSDVGIHKNGKPEKAFEEFEQASKKILSPWNADNFISIKNLIKKRFNEWLRFETAPVTRFFEFGEVSHTYKCLEKDESNNLLNYFNDVDRIIYSYSLNFLVSAASTIKASLRAQGKLTFTEYLMIFRNMVIEDMNNGMKLINHIRKKHSYFLIDESQDTSPAQTELFIYLSSAVEAHSLKDCEPIPGSIFIVGDPKQSIYGFRGADVDAYLGTKQLFENVYDPKYNQVVYLTRNFRSTYELREYFNDKFKDLPNYVEIPLTEDPIPPQIKDDVLSGVYHSIDYLTAIKSLVGKHYIFDKNLLKDNPSSLGKRLIEYKDIMLLTWSTTNHDRVMDALRINNIPFYCEGKYYINELDVIETVYALYAYICGDSGQFHNLLSSPLFNVSPNGLLGIDTIDDLPEGKDKDFILSLESLKTINNPIILLETIIEKLKLFKYIDFANVEYALFTLEKMKEQYNSLKVSDIRSGEQFLKDFLSTKLERCMNMEYVPNAVNLANVHKVKGLEKPVVILVGCSTNTGRKAKNDSNFLNNEAFVFRTGEYSYKNATLYEIDHGGLFIAEEETAKQKKLEEDERLGYVAVTRARNVLVQTNPGGATDPWPFVKVDNPKTIPFSELPDVSFAQANEFSFEEPGEFDSNKTYIERSPSKTAHIVSKLSEEVEEHTEEVVIQDIDSRIKGTIVHKLMQKIVNSKGKLPKDILIKNILNEYSLEDSSPYKSILENVYNTMFNGGYPQLNGVSNDLLKILFQSECQCEVPFSYKEGSNIWQGEIDLLYVYNGQYYIVDYKTNADDSDLDKMYQKQLEAYKKVLKLSLGVDAITYIYHIGA